MLLRNVERKTRFRRRSTHVPNLIDELSPAKERRLNQCGTVVLIRCGNVVKFDKVCRVIRHWSGNWFIRRSSHVPNQMHKLWQCTIFPWCTPTLGSTHSTPSESVVAPMSAHEWSGLWTGPKLTHELSKALSLCVITTRIVTGSVIHNCFPHSKGKYLKNNSGFLRVYCK